MVKKNEHHRPRKTRRELEAEYGAVWDTRQLARAFVILSIIVPGEIVVRRKIDGTVGTMQYQDGMRYYYNFTPAPQYTDTEPQVK